ncbi:MAG: PilZ domain-containing protein [Planctomycetes bacterium]|nr:PilZ domain-containing protein [Planctomycetota bacterium]
MKQSNRNTPLGVESLSGLTVAVQGDNGTSYQGTLIQFMGGTLRVQFWGDDLPAFGLTQPISIYIQGLNTELPALPACAMERNELPGGRAYRFAYTPTPEFQALIPEDLWSLFPSRASHRVRPTEAMPALVTLEDLAGGHKHGGTVLDISTTGVGLTVDREAEQQLHSQRVIRLHFQFPSLTGAENETIVFGKVMHRRMTGSEIRYGISFDVELELETVGQDALIRYIVEQEKHQA